MLRTIRQLALIAWSGAALLAFYVPAVQADSAGAAPTASATTLPATHLKVTSAVLNASIETRGQPTEWEFQYGATTNHDDATPLQLIQAGHGTIRVSARITGLAPGKTYHFRAIAFTGIGRNYVEVYYAADRAFTTKRWHGAVALVRKTLHVSGHAVGVRLKCASKRACAGHLSIGTQAQGSPGGTVVCATKSFKVGAGRRRMVRARVSNDCMALLAQAPHHRLKAAFSSATTTGQRGQHTGAELVLG